MRITTMFHAALLAAITSVAACSAQDAPTVPCRR